MSSPTCRETPGNIPESSRIPPPLAGGPLSVPTLPPVRRLGNGPRAAIPEEALLLHTLPSHA